MSAITLATLARAPAHRSSAGYTLYLWVVVLLLPIDWFGPTGMLFREFGAKPASLVLTLGGLFGLAFCRSPRGGAGRIERNAVLICGAMVTFGVIAFCINQLANWSPDGYSRSPIVQFVTQTLLFIAAIVATIGNARLAWRWDALSLVRSIVPAAAMLHLIVFGLQALSIIDHFSPALLLFRNDGGVIERPTGLMSEPSYYGVCAALFGAILLTTQSMGGQRIIHIALAALLYATAVYVNAKTMVVVAGAQLILAIVFPAAGRVSFRTVFLLTVAIAALAVSFTVRFSALDVSENLSSAMRFGSTLLSINAGASGYSVSGIGIGQFHFFYRDVFAPDFLYLSSEGLNQLNTDAINRASTFNLYTRLVLETGLAGFAVFVFSMIFLLRTKLTSQTKYIATLFAGSLGFLMTQDTYFYPPFVLSCALLLGVRYTAGTNRMPSAPFLCSIRS